MKKLALVSSYCDTEEKLSILRKNCSLLKSLGIDVFVSSPLKIEVDCDFLFITKENPILNWPDKAISLFRIIPYEGRELKLQPLISDSGWASLYQFKKMMEFASTFDYEIFYVLIYDLLIDDKIIEDLNNNICNITYPRRDFTDKSHIFPSSFHLSIFDKDNLKLVSSLIQLHTYKSQDGFAEDFIEKWFNVIGLRKSKHVVEDLINIQPKNVFNLSLDPNYRYFINKEHNEKLKFFVHHFDKPILFKINELVIEITDGPKLVETEIFCEDLNFLSISCDGREIDYTNQYREITRNIVEFI